MTLEDISKLANFSMYHFHRIFRSYARESVSEYTRRRRLTQAAHDLLYTNSRIIDIAMDYHFESQESFTRSFKKMFHVTPGAFRKNEKRLLLREKPRLTERRLSFLNGGLQMEPKVIRNEGFKVIGMKCRTTLASNRVPALWEEFLRRVNEIHDRTSPNISMGISEFSQNHLDEEFVCMACVPVNRFASIPEGMVCKTIPTMQYVVVTHKGKLPTLGNAFDYIYTTWLPNSGVYGRLKM